MMSNTIDTLFEELKLYPVTRHIVISLFGDLPLTPVALNDFGVETADHCRVLQEVLFGGPAADEESSDDHKAYQALCKRIKEIDAAYGNGPILMPWCANMRLNMHKSCIFTPDGMKSSDEQKNRRRRRDDDYRVQYQRMILNPPMIL